MRALCGAANPGCSRLSGGFSNRGELSILGAMWGRLVTCGRLLIGLPVAPDTVLAPGVGDTPQRRYGVTEDLSRSKKADCQSAAGCQPAPHRRSQAGVTLIEVLVAITLLSLLSVAMLVALRIGLSAYSKTNAKLMDDRRVAGAQRVLEQELEGIVPAVGPCTGMPQAIPGTPPNGPTFGFFQASPQTMRLVSTFSLQQGWRGRPQILELFVIPRDDAEGVRLVVNEVPYSGPLAAGRMCVGMVPVPEAGITLPTFLPVTAGPTSFVLADKLAYCRFAYLWPPKKAEEPPVWSPTALNSGWPLAIRIEMAPLVPDPSTLQPLTVTAALHLHLSPTVPYGDF